MPFLSTNQQCPCTEHILHSSRHDLVNFSNTSYRKLTIWSDLNLPSHFSLVYAITFPTAEHHYSVAFVKLCCLVTVMCVWTICLKLFVKGKWSAAETVTSLWRVRCPNHYINRCRTRKLFGTAVMRFLTVHPTKSIQALVANSINTAQSHTCTM